MGNKILYLECYSGISGDMTVAALLDLAGNQDRLRAALDSLRLPGYRIEIGRREKCGIDAAAFDVILEEGPQPLSFDHNSDQGQPVMETSKDHDSHVHPRKPPAKKLKFKQLSQNQAQANGMLKKYTAFATSDHSQSQSHDPGHSHSHSHSNDHSHDHSNDHDHSHINDHDHSHAHGHSQGQGHSHVDQRNINDINRIIDASGITDSAKKLARRVFMILAVAESKAHGLGVEEVHFHEVGAIDSIVDIVAACVLVDSLGVDDIVISQIHEGSGHVWCQHGVIPVPVPATLNIASEYGLSLKITDTKGEMVTPTGAALAAALRTKPALPADYRILKTGTGAGKKDFRHANILRAFLLEETQENGSNSDQVTLLETNLDDATGEALGFAMEMLLEAGAKDVWYTPIQMKKNRPAYKLSVMCAESDRMNLERLIFRHTTAIGIRRLVMERTVLPRKILQVETAYGSVSVKQVEAAGELFHTPEYEDLRRILKTEDLSFQALHDAVLQAVKEKLQD